MITETYPTYYLDGIRKIWIFLHKPFLKGVYHIVIFILMLSFLSSLVLYVSL